MNTFPRYKKERCQLNVPALQDWYNSLPQNKKIYAKCDVIRNVDFKDKKKSIKQSFQKKYKELLSGTDRTSVIDFLNDYSDYLRHSEENDITSF